MDILEYNSQDQKKTKREPIDFYINCVGGDSNSTITIVNAILASKTPIVTINIGKCYSGGFYVFLAGHRRYALPGSTFLYHELVLDTGDISITQAEWSLNIVKEMQSFCEKLVVDRTEITKKELHKINRENKQWYMDVDESIKLGIINGVV
jgi:ATP-dependent Clp protease protease subunit